MQPTNSGFGFPRLCARLLQLLEKGGFLRQGNIVIIDEPEVHLHPKWQLLYAEIIICLVQQGTHVIVTTHSPYILEAL